MTESGCSVVSKMDKSGSVDGSESVDGQEERWMMVGRLLANRRPAVYAQLLALAESTAAELSTEDETFIG